MAFPFVGLFAKVVAPLLLSILSSQGVGSGLFFEIELNGILSAVLFSTYDEMDLSHLTEISDERLYEAKGHWVVKLNGLKTLSPRQEKILAGIQGNVHLDGLTELDEPLVDELSRRFCSLSLNGIKRISLKSFKKLANKDGFLSLASIGIDDLRNLQEFFHDPEIHSFLSFDGIKNISVEDASIFRRYHGTICFNKIKSMEDDVIAALAKSEACFHFDSLDMITDAQAEILSTFKRPISLPGLKKVTDRQFFSFCKSKTPIELASLEELSDRQLQMLSGANNLIRFRNLSSLPKEIIRHYRKHEVDAQEQKLDFPFVQALDDEQARELSHYAGVIKLNGLKKLSRKQASYLGTTTGELQLNGLTSLSPGCASELLNQKGGIFLNGLSSIDEGASAHFRKHIGPIILDGAITVTDQNVRHFSAHSGTLSLAKWSQATELQIELLARKKPPLYADNDPEKRDEIFPLFRSPTEDCDLSRNSLILNGLKSISSAQAENLSKCAYNLEINGIARLNAEQARCFLDYNKDLELNGLTEIDDYALGILFQRSAQTSLGAIKKISLNHATMLSERDSESFQSLSLHGVRNLPVKYCDILGSKRTAMIFFGDYAIDDDCKKALGENPGIYLGGRTIAER